MHKEDHDKLDLSYSLDNDDNSGLEDKPIDELTDGTSQASRRHVWIQDGEKLRAVEVVVGVSDYRYHELVSGELEPGQQVVTGLKPKK